MRMVNIPRKLIKYMIGEYKMSGMLYLVATPIGNLEDMTYRAVRTLMEVDLIAAEDTRQTLKLLNRFNISKPLVSYHEHNKLSKGEYLIEQLLNGKNIALVSDAGTPAISDPGEELVREAINNNITITSIPGPCAAISGLILSGFYTSRFAFEGFLSRNKKIKKERLLKIKDDSRTMVFYEAPHKLINTLECMLEMLGDRNICLARELTKKFEEIIRIKISQAIKQYSDSKPIGEFVIIVEGKLDKEEKKELNNDIILDRVRECISSGKDKNESFKIIAKEFKIPKRDIYKMYLEEK